MLESPSKKGTFSNVGAVVITAKISSMPDTCMGCCSTLNSDKIYYYFPVKSAFI